MMDQSVLADLGRPHALLEALLITSSAPSLSLLTITAAQA